MSFETRGHAINTYQNKETTDALIDKLRTVRLRWSCVDCGLLYVDVYVLCVSEVVPDKCDIGLPWEDQLD
jgi:hypothetical protein